MHIHYIKADPSGNTTIFVFDTIAAAQRSIVAAELLRPEGIGAEQVAYISVPEKREEPIRIDMMGGEFCGNASRSAAAYVLMQDQQEWGNYLVSCSGCDTVLAAHARRRGEGIFDAFIAMPLPEAVEAVIIEVDGLPSRFFRVALPGIVHFVHMVTGIDRIDKEVFWKAVCSYAADEALAAFGLILFDPSQLKMIPAVYVTATDTLYWEQSCGSGSAAVAAALACMGKKNVSCRIRQPGGVIEITASWAADGLKSIYIGGPVTFNVPGDIWLDI